MNKTKMLIGSLSNDLLRVANLVARGSDKGAKRFFIEAKRWNTQLKNHQVKPYIANIISDIETEADDTNITIEKAEKYLMYSILLQNYCL